MATDERKDVAEEVVVEDAQTMDSATIDYHDNFVPAVHKIGQSTMAIAFVLSFVPIAYFALVKGYSMPISSYINVMIPITAAGLGMWLTEPLAYWPVLGSAATYMGYLSGNVGGMRFPVATNVQTTMNADINTPRGQVATIIGVAASVFTNLVILLVIVLAGSWILSIMPDSVKAALSFVSSCLYGSMIMMRLNPRKGGFAAGIPKVLPLLTVAVITKYVLQTFFPQTKSFATAIVTAVTIAVAYVSYRAKLAKKAD